MNDFLDNLKEFGVREVSEEVTHEYQEEVQQEVVQEETVVEEQQDVETQVEEQEVEAQQEQQQKIETPTEGSSFKFGKKQVEKTQGDVGLNDDVVLSYLNEKLGLSAKSIQDLSKPKDVSTELDAELEAVLKFKRETGKSLSDYYVYQQLNTSEMGDIDAVRLKYQLEYPELSAEERDILMQETYKLDEDVYSENEIRLAKVRLKADAVKAKNEINKVRELYAAPAKQEDVKAESLSIFDGSWFKQMESTVNNLESLEFELGDNEVVRFNVEPSYKQKLKETNKGVERYLDQYLDEKGNWNHELFNAHLAALDNLEEIVKVSYHQGLSNGQKKIVETASNVKSKTQQPTQQNKSVADAMMEFAKNFGKNNSKGLVIGS